MNEQLQIAIRPETVKRAARVALTIGTVLAVINHYDEILVGGLTIKVATQILLCYVVPYLVSTHGQVVGKRTK